MATSDSSSETFRPRIGGRRGQIKPERGPTFRCTMIAKIDTPAQAMARAYRCPDSVAAPPSH
jgi:hypothetical protein